MNNLKLNTLITVCSWTHERSFCNWTHCRTLCNFLHRQFTTKCVDKHFTVEQIGKYLTAPLMNILQMNSLMNILQLNSLMNILQLNTFLFFLQSSRFSLNRNIAFSKLQKRVCLSVISSDTLCKVENVLFLKVHIAVCFMSKEIEALPQTQILNSLYLCNLYLFKLRSFDPTEVIDWIVYYKDKIRVCGKNSIPFIVFLSWLVFSINKVYRE